jgi:MGT family glycosyltransferase
MSRFVFITSPFMGHINPTLSVGAELLKRGHEVIWLSLLKLPEESIPLGGKLFLIEGEVSQYSENETSSSEGWSKKLFGMESLVNLYENVLLPLNRYMYKGISRLIDKISPDTIITDHQAFAGAICAYKKNIPYITFVTAPAAVIQSRYFPKVIEWESQQIIKLQKELGINVDRSVACSEMRTVVFSSQEFIGNYKFPENYSLVGPVLENRSITGSFNWEMLVESDFPKVLVSIGSIIKEEKEFFSTIIQSFGNLPLTVVVVANPKLFKKWPGNFIVQEHIPQIGVLSYADAVICHGGHNTVCESLYHGVPVITIPIVNDQSLVATQVVNAGCGLRLKFKRLTVRQLQDSLHELLSNEKYRKAAIDISNSFKKAGGTKKAADLLEEVEVNLLIQKTYMKLITEN